MVVLLAALLLASPPHPNGLIDGGLTLGAGLSWLALDAVHADWVTADCPCHADRVNALDRPAITLNFQDGERWADVTTGLGMIAPFAALLLISPDTQTWAEDALLVLESMAFAGLLTQGAKTVVGRPYPYLYQPDHDALDSDGANYASFWSGHTAVPMAGAVTFAWILQTRHPKSRWRWVAWIVGPALAITGGVFQITANNHFTTDVIAGAFAGAGVGLINPWLHTAW